MSVVVIVAAIAATIAFAWFVFTAPTPEDAADHEGRREDPERVAARSLSAPAEAGAEADGVIDRGTVAPGWPPRPIPTTRYE